MNIAALEALPPAVLIEPVRDAPSNAGQSFGALLDGASAELRRADDAAALVALGRGSIADAAVQRAKADVALEVAAIAASRVSTAVTTLLQTQV
ncbi:MAG: hypothetical protein JO347_00400 [Candidatus Eremiobacteraeota bacterium]|nr:hypothetical protein [Candidatus Eremiobacteraeota bacterium]